MIGRGACIELLITIEHRSQHFKVTSPLAGREGVSRLGDGLAPNIAGWD